MIIFIICYYTIAVIAGRVYLLLRKFASYEETNKVGFHTARDTMYLLGYHTVDVMEYAGNGFDSRIMSVMLDREVYRDANLASTAIALHEVGHVRQYFRKYTGMKIKKLIMPFYNRYTSLCNWLILPCMLLSFAWPVTIHVSFYLCLGLLVLNLLPVVIELDATRHAIGWMRITRHSIYEIRLARAMLVSAAFTYLLPVTSKSGI